MSLDSLRRRIDQAEQFTRQHAPDPLDGLTDEQLDARIAKLEARIAAEETRSAGRGRRSSAGARTADDDEDLDARLADASGRLRRAMEAMGETTGATTGEDKQP
jgi:hypothetical protein